MKRIDYNSIFGKPADEIGSIIKDLQMFFDKDIFEVKHEPPTPPEPKHPASNEIWYWGEYYDMQKFIDLLAGWDYEYLGPNIISNEFDGEKWIITFDGDVEGVGDGYESYTSYPCFYDDSFEHSISCNVTKIEFGSAVATIGRYAIDYIPNLEEVTIPISVTSISSGAISECPPFAVNYLGTKSQWNSIEKEEGWDSNQVLVIHCTDGDIVDEGPETILYLSNGSTVSIRGRLNPGGGTESSKVYHYRNTVVRAEIGDGLEIIDDESFYECSVLETVVIPNSVTEIGYDAFSYCSSLSNINIPDSVTEIKNGFQGCDSLPVIDYIKYADTYLVGPEDKSIAIYLIKQGTRFIGGSAFYNCYNMQSITIPDSVISIGDSAFSDCHNLYSINIPNGVTSIGSYAFSYCSSLTTISIPDSVTNVGEYVFNRCGNLRVPVYNSNIFAVLPINYSSTYYVVPDGIKTIISGAFSNNRNNPTLLRVVIPNSVENIEEYAFLDCRALEYILLNSITPPLLENDYVFPYEYTNSCPILVPNESINAYMTAEYWSSLSDRIQPIPEQNTISITYNTDHGTAPSNKIYSLLRGELSYYNGDVEYRLTPDDVPTLTDDGYIFNGWWNAEGTNKWEMWNYIQQDEIFYAHWTKNEDTEAWQLGYTAGEQDRESGETSSNPYSQGTSNYSLWESGYNAGYNDSVTILTLNDDSKVYIYDNVLSAYGKPYMYNIVSCHTGSNVTSIDHSAFVSCTNLLSINIPNSVISLGNNAFNGCTGLTTIVIPSSVTSMGWNTFRYCSSLTSITCESTTPPTLDDNDFSNTNNCPIYVPAASVETYKTTSGWSDYADRIQAIPELVS